MPITSLGAGVKILLGLAITYLLFNYVNILENQALGVGFGFLAVFLIIWGISYFIYLILRRVSSTHSHDKIISVSYRLSLMTGVYVLINLALMLIDRWTLLLGVGMAILFLVLQYSISIDIRKKKPV